MRLKHSAQGKAVQLHRRTRAFLQHGKPVRLADGQEPAVWPKQHCLGLHRDVASQMQQSKGTIIRCSQEAAPARAWLLSWLPWLEKQLLGFRAIRCQLFTCQHKRGARCSGSSDGTKLASDHITWFHWLMWGHRVAHVWAQHAEHSRRQEAAVRGGRCLLRTLQWPCAPTGTAPDPAINTALVRGEQHIKFNKSCSDSTGGGP